MTNPSTPTAPKTSEVKARKVIERAVAMDLLQAVYEAEGWQRAWGETMTKRVKQFYVITADARRNRYIATPIVTSKDAPHD